MASGRHRWGPETCSVYRRSATLIEGFDSASYGRTSIGALCPITSMAPVPAITGMVARTHVLRPRWGDYSTVRHRAEPRPDFQIRRERMRSEASTEASRKAKKELARRLRSADPGLEVVHANAAG